MKYICEGSNHTPITICSIPSGVLNRLAKINSCKPSFYYEKVYNNYHNRAYALCEAGLATPIFPKMGQQTIYVKLKRSRGQKQIGITILCCIFKLFFFVHPKGNQQAFYLFIYLVWYYGCLNIDSITLPNYIMETFPQKMVGKSSMLT